MYEEIVKSVTSSKEYTCLGDLVSTKKCIEPGSEAYQESGIVFLRVSNLSKFGMKDGNQQYLSEELYNTLIQHQPKKSEILLSKDATPGIAYYLKDEPSRMIPSGGILRLKVNDENKLYPEYLTLVLNSVIVQKQIERDVGGSVINHWLVDQVKNTLIPILPIAKQKKIAKMVNDSFCNRELSKLLLEVAKRGVELAIEKDEKQAQNWINSELKKLNIK
jgi:restriction endonuclease S subunit